MVPPLNRLLILGDTHIPSRALKIPRVLEDIICREAPFDYIFFTGDLTDNQVLLILNRWSEDVYVVRGNMDYIKLPISLQIDVGKVKIGLIHGHQVYPRGNYQKLMEIASKMGVKVLISGHTHYPFVTKYKNYVLLNPGSATGVWSGGKASMIPSFMIGVLHGNMLNINLYEARSGRVFKSYLELII